MKKKDKHSMQQADKIIRYRSGKMTDSERNTFERELQKDPFLADALDGLSGLSAEELQSDIDKLGGRLESITRKRTPVYYRIAAAVIVLLGISSILLIRQLKGPELVSDNLQLSEDSLRTKVIESPLIIEENLSEVAQTTKNTESRKVNNDLPETGQLVEPVLDAKPEQSERRETLKVDERAVEGRLAGIAVQREDALPIEAAKKENSIVLRGISSKASKARGVDLDSSPQNYVRGRILASDDNLPIPGVSIHKKGSNKGIATDYDGRFLIEADSGDVLVASFIGMESMEILVGNENINDVLLKPDLLGLDEVVVTAYGVERDESEDISDNYIRALPGSGMTKFRDYIRDNHIFPEDWTNSDREVVRLKFTVKLDNTLSNF
ncbi:MAG: carboxypeptidase-like regulatory domain-containing protein, partial [Bacteroidales bacterium]|nr:carboxypeptidase-like regulatory domain-containing protein [Bacteroidales bacterium]